MNNWTEWFGSGVIAGIIASLIQFLISHFEHRFITKTKKSEQVYRFIEWQRDEIGKLIKEVSQIKVPAITETNEDVIENAYHLIIADFERAKPLLYKKNDPVTIKGFFNALNGRYTQMQDIKLGNETKLKLEDSKRILIREIEICKQKLLAALQEKEQDKEKEIMVN